MRASAAKRSWRRLLAFIDFCRWYFIGGMMGVIVGSACSSGAHYYEVGPFPGTHSCHADPDCDYGERCTFGGGQTLECRKAETPW